MGRAPAPLDSWEAAGRCRRAPLNRWQAEVVAEWGSGIPAGSYPANRRFESCLRYHTHEGRPPVSTAPTPDQVVHSWVVCEAALVRKAWKAGPGSHLQLHLFDDRYHALPQELWEQVVAASHTNDLKYVRSFFDCNSFADALKGVVKARYAVNGVGFVADTSGKHAFNAVIIAPAAGATQPTFAFVEPQRDSIIEPQSKPCYDLKQGFVIF